jgi:hypothetical protein
MRVLRSLPALALPALLGGCGLFDWGTSEAPDTDWDEEEATNPTPDPDPTAPTATFFEPYLMTVAFETGLYDGELGSTFFQGTEVPPFVVVGLYEEDYLLAFDDRYRCEWVGTVDALSLHDLGLGDALWIGWEVALSVFDTDCADLNPQIFGDDSGTQFLENLPLGLGLGPLSEDFENQLAAEITDWETDYAPYAFSGFVATEDNATGELVGIEMNLALSFALDSDGEWRTQGDSLVAREATGDFLDWAYVRTFPWYALYVEPLL